MPKKDDRKNRLIQSVELSNLIYNVQQNEENLKNVIKTDNKDVEIFTSQNGHDINRTIRRAKKHSGIAIIYSSNIENNSNESSNFDLESAIIINTRDKQVTVVTSGTRIEDGIKKAKSDIRDDAALALGLEPFKLETLRSLNEMIIDQLGEEDVPKYNFHYTGHSLGAALSDCAATDMAILLRSIKSLKNNRISTATFDNPGTHSLVTKQLRDTYNNAKRNEKVEYYKAIKKIRCSKNTDEDKISKISKIKNKYKKRIQKLEGAFELDDFKKIIDYKTFNNRPNLINTADQQVGKQFTIEHQDQEELGFFYNFCGWLAEILPESCFKEIFKKISFGPISQQISEHKMPSFIDVIKNRKGIITYEDKDENRKYKMTLRDIAHSTEPLEYDKKYFNLLNDTKKDFNEKPIYSMTKEKDGKRYRIEFGKEHLDYVVSIINAQEHMSSASSEYSRSSSASRRSSKTHSKNQGRARGE